MAYSVRQWPRVCPQCGGRLGPQLDSPWSEDAYLIQTEAELAATTEGTAEFYSAQVQVLYARQSLAGRHGDAIEAANLQRQVALVDAQRFPNRGFDDTFSHRSHVVRILLQGGAFQRAIDEGLKAVAEAEVEGVMNDQVRNLALWTAQAGVQMNDQEAINIAAPLAIHLAETLTTSTMPRILQEIDELREKTGSRRLEPRTYKLDHLVAMLLEDFVMAMHSVGNPGMIETTTSEGPTQRNAPGGKGWIVSQIPRLDGEWVVGLYAFPDGQYALGTDDWYSKKNPIDVKSGVDLWGMVGEWDDEKRVTSLRKLAQELQEYLTSIGAQVPDRMLRIGAFPEASGRSSDKVEASVIDM